MCWPAGLPVIHDTRVAHRHVQLPTAIYMISAS